MIRRGPQAVAQPPAASNPTWGNLLQALATTRHGHPAVVADDATLTFGELLDRAREIARAMMALGVRRGDVVAVLDGNTAAWLEVFCGASLIGATCAPVNTWYQQREIAEQLGHSGARALFSVAALLKHDYAAQLTAMLPSLADRAAAGGELTEPDFPSLRRVVAMPGAGDIPGGMGWKEFLACGAEVSEAALDAAIAQVEPDDVLHILYTSGSTSRPKGVQVTHRGVIENAFQVGQRLHLAEDDRFWHSGPLFYGLATVFTLPATWTHGATYLIQSTFKPGPALALIERERVTAFAGYGNVTRALVQHQDFAGTDTSSLVKGATGFTREDKRIAVQDLGVSSVCAMYGLTESHGPCSITEAGDDLETLLETQGFLVPGWEAELRDPRTGEPTPDAQPGELYIRGRMMPGYLDDDAENAEVFAADGWFRTGDLVEFDEQGRLRFQSRAKEVIKVGGINVSPTEIEGLIDEHPDVRQVHVVGVPDPVKGQLVVAFVVAARADLDEGELRDFVAARAARFKVPARVFFRSVEQMPIVASGKVPRFRLAQEAITELGLA